MPSLDSRIEGFAMAEAAQLPAPGAGATPQRHRALCAWGKDDLSFARIAEAHTDAIAILAECEHSPRAGALYGVWASDAPPSRVSCERLGSGDWRIEGIKPFCSGAAFVDAALVTAHHSEGLFLFDLPIRGSRVLVQPTAWVSPAFADTATTAVKFDSLIVPDAYRLGGAGWYLSRPGFWHGAIGPAACWAGGAISLVEAATRLDRRDPHTRAHVGALQAIGWGLNAVLEQAGREIDDNPNDTSATPRVRALKVRHLIERACTETLDRFGRATGPHLLAYDVHVVRQHLALTLYIRQCHGERDLEGIATSSTLA
ncbi:MAG: acyl-CoA dehydrogenase family protein [Steroidobacteraceae bacterium]